MGKKDKKKKRSGGIHSPLDHHKVVGKKLVPPLRRVPKTSFSSWRDDHAPEMLWALSLAAVLPRQAYLSCFREVARWVHKNAEELWPRKPPDDKGDFEKVGMPCEVDMTSLAGLPDGKFSEFCKIIVKHPLSHAALRPMLLVESLPGLERWKTDLGAEPTVHDWATLGGAVIHTFNHQSEKSTDVRWLKLAVKMGAGRFGLSREGAEEINRFPNLGDMRQVRPKIRAAEMNLRRNPPPQWIGQYWAQLLRDTNCIDSSFERDYSQVERPLLMPDTITNARAAIMKRFYGQASTTGKDAKLDSAFGFCLYALSVLEEASTPPISQLLLGRLGLRTLSELVITFAYLVEMNDEKLWDAYRSYGSGQAKLAFLKLEEASGDAPTFVTSETLEAIANEDLWQGTSRSI